MSENKSCKNFPRKVPELLAPAGSFDKLITAVHYGADAVYLGGPGLSLRAKAGNFSLPEMGDGIAYAHSRGVKVYVTVNIFAHNRDLAGLHEYLLALARLQADGLIIADPGILAIARKTVPHMTMHLSTQANITNYRAAQFWFAQGVSRLNLARELSFAEIRTVREHCAGELEVFVHGALCISYSGRCMLSNYLTGRDANQGHCAHPCRFSYALVEEKRPGQIFPVEEDERGTYIFNAKDLCLLDQLPKLMAAGVDSLKIEGRMKSIFYVGGVVRVYRAALDYLAGLPQEIWENDSDIELPPSFREEIAKCGTRGMTENFFADKPGPEEMIYTSSRLSQQYEPVAVIRETAPDLLVEIRNTVWPGEEVELMGAGLATQTFRIVRMLDGDDAVVEKANPGNIVRCTLAPTPGNLKPHDIFRRARLDSAG
jgi:putative protease